MTAVTTQSTNALALYSAGQSDRPKSPIEIAASLFGMSASDLSAELKSGKSLNDVAKEEGVSTDDLDAALVKGMPPSTANSGDAMAIAKKMAAEVGGPRGPRPGGGHHARPATTDAATSSSSGSTSSTSSSMLDELSSLLGTDSSSLKSSLTSGTSLSDLLSQKGISMSDLAASLQQGVLLDTTA